MWTGRVGATRQILVILYTVFGCFPAAVLSAYVTFNIANTGLIGLLYSTMAWIGVLGLYFATRSWIRQSNVRQSQFISLALLFGIVAYQPFLTVRWHHVGTEGGRLVGFLFILSPVVVAGHYIVCSIYSIYTSKD